MIGEQDTFGINRNFGAPEETFSINLKKRKHFAWLYITMVKIVICLLTENNL